MAAMPLRSLFNAEGRVRPQVLEGAALCAVLASALIGARRGRKTDKPPAKAWTYLGWISLAALAGEALWRRNHAAPAPEAAPQRTPVQPVWPLRRLSVAARRARHTLPWRSWIAA